MLQMLLGSSLSSPGSGYVLFLLSTLVYVYVGKPLLEGLLREVRARNLGMMVLIIVAISAAYFYILAMVFDILPWERFFGSWPPLVGIMLLCHRAEMRSVLGASGILKELVNIMPATVLPDRGQQ